MNRLDLIIRVRSYTRDFSNGTFREGDIVHYINEGIDRCKQVIPELRGMQPLLRNEHVLTLLPDMYEHLLAIYSAARCFEQDERHFQAGNLMNEFETKLYGLKVAIESGELDIIDPDGNIVLSPYIEDNVRDVYFNPKRGGFD